jgi:glycosyltransferase involved in cell wall biosynthesis
MSTGLLCAAYPPSIDGIGDYTHLLAGHLARRSEVAVYTGFQNSYAPAGRVSVRGIFNPSRPATIRNLGRILEDGPPVDRLIVQYNPFGFGPRGFNPWLPMTLAQLRKRLSVSVMFHETYVPCGTAAQCGMRLWQIPQFFFLSRIADSTYASCSRWLPAIRRASGRDAVHLPVASNVVRSKLSREEARGRLAIGGKTLVLGVFGSAHPSRLLDWIAMASARLKSRRTEVLLVYVGADGEKLRLAVGDGVRLLDCGLLPADAVGDHLMAADVLLAPFVDGLSTRRGSVAAAFQHGLPVLSTSSVWTDAMLLDQEERLIFLSPVDAGPMAYCELAERVSARLPAQDSQRMLLSCFYEQHFGWEAVSRTLLGDTPASGCCDP